MKRKTSELLIKELLKITILSLLLEDFKYVLAVSGVQSVSICGVIVMLLLLVDNLDLNMLMVSLQLMKSKT